MNLKQTIKKIFSILGIQIIKDKTYQKLIKLDKYAIYAFFEEISANYHLFLKNIPYSKSQNGQDLIVLDFLDYKTDGYFVEFGATDGVNMSNSYLLETKFNWKGILGEPAKIYHHKLINNRNVEIETNLVWSKSGDELLFNETSSALTSTIDSFSNSDFNKRITKNKYKIETISLNDLLKKYNAPKKIDYLSIDTEGSEYEILSNFNFNEYDIRVITCEHNFVKKKREDIFKLLSKYKYQRKYEEFSQYDDWYFKL